MTQPEALSVRMRNNAYEATKGDVRAWATEAEALETAIKRTIAATRIELDHPSGDLADELANVMQAFICKRDNAVMALEKEIAETKEAFANHIRIHDRAQAESAKEIAELRRDRETFTLQSEDTPQAVVNDLPLMRDRCHRVGLHATGQLMHEAIRKSGWELAEQLERAAMKATAEAKEKP